MKTKIKLLSRITAMAHSKWMPPVLMTLALFAILLVLTGCPHHH
jgi:hypothetical protein